MSLLTNFGLVRDWICLDICLCCLDHPRGCCYVFIVENHPILYYTSYPAPGLITRLKRVVGWLSPMSSISCFGWIQLRHLTLQKIVLGDLTMMHYVHRSGEWICIPNCKITFTFKLSIRNCYLSEASFFRRQAFPGHLRFSSLDWLRRFIKVVPYFPVLCGR